MKRFQNKGYCEIEPFLLAFDCLIERAFNEFFKIFLFGIFYREVGKIIQKRKRDKMVKKIVIGLMAGFISGFFASGGGMILVPAFVYLMELDETKARASSILAILPMVMASSFFYIRNDFFDWSLGIKCVIGGVVGAVIGSKLLKKMSNQFLKLSFTIFLLYVSIRMIL